MGRPSIFSNNYKQQRKKRRVNTILFILLIISISFFGGKYYLSKHDIPLVNNITNSKIVKDIAHFDWISKIKGKFTKKETNIAVKPTSPKSTVSAVKITTGSAISTNINNANKTYEYSYLANDGKNYYVEYLKTGTSIAISGLKDETDTSDYCISKDKSMIVFDVKSDNSIILCNAKGNFTVISRSEYKMKSTGKIITKETVLARYKNYIWAQKPYFTLDGRVVYVSRLPYIRTDNTLYLWSVNIDGSNNKKISKINKDISKISYGGYDNKNRLKVMIDGNQYYIDNGSFMLSK